MDYQGPEAADLANVYSLNRAYLDELRRHDAAVSGTVPGLFNVAAELALLSRAKARIRSSDSPVQSLIVRVRASWRIIRSASSNWLRSPA